MAVSKQKKKWPIFFNNTLRADNILAQAIFIAILAEIGVGDKP
jgi:hypothetical protein